MKKLLLVCVIILAMGLLALCFWQQNIDTAQYEFFSEEHMENCLVPELPALPSGENISRRAFDSEFYFYASENDFDAYVESVYAYLCSRGFRYLGYRGDKLGALANYEFFAGEELFDHRVFENAGVEKRETGYIFIWSDDAVGENGAFAEYHYIEIYRTAKLQEYGENTGFGYNSVMKLKSDSGDYTLTEEARGGFVRTESDFIPYALAYTAPASIDAAQKKVTLGLFYGLLEGNSIDADYESVEIAISIDGAEAQTVRNMKLLKLADEQYAVREVKDKTGKTHLVYAYEDGYSFSAELLTGEAGVITVSLTEYAGRGGENELEGFRTEIEIPYKKIDGKIVFGE